MRCSSGHFTDPSDYSDVTEGACPSCGTPFPDQPSPIHSEMEMRNMPAPGEEDQGGNPLQEGILADNGWQNAQNRDESFAASIRSSIIERQEAVIPWHMAADADFEIEQVVAPGPHTVEVDAPDQPIILQHSDPGVLDAVKTQLTASGADLLGLGGGAAGGAAGAAAGLALAPETGGLSLIAAPLIGRAVGGLMGHTLGQGVGNALGLGGVPAPGPGIAQAPEQFRGIDQLSHIVGAFGDHSPGDSSQEHVPSNDTSDPEQVDPGEKNDGDNDAWEKDFSVNEDGGTAHPFDENGGGLEAAQLLLPLLVHHFQNGTGADDPLMHALDGMLEAEAPGYKDAEPDHAAIDELLAALKGDKRDEGAPHVKDEAGDDGADDSLDDNDIEKESATHTASGPRTPEQFKAVADLLREQGRDSDLQNLIDSPDQYEQELAEVQQRQVVNPAETPDQPMAPPMPTQEETPPGAGMPMPAPPTGVQPIARTASWFVLAEEGHDHVIAPDTDSAIADPSQREGLTWQDENGEPLKVNQEYDMYSERYEIPDHIRVTAVRPDAIDYELVNTYNIPHQAQITRQDADLYHYTFVTSQGPDDQGSVNQVNDSAPTNAYAGQADPSQVTDVSDSRGASFQRGIVSRSAQPETDVVPSDGVDHGDPELDWLREAGAKFTLSEQREFVSEPGVARNADRLDLSNTHYEGSGGAEDDDFLFGL